MRRSGRTAVSNRRHWPNFDRLQRRRICEPPGFGRAAPPRRRYLVVETPPDKGMKLTTRLLVLLAMLLSIDSQADSTHTGSISGRVTDARTCAPIPYANVIVVGATIGAMTDGQGTFRISNVPPGKWDVRAMMIQYKSSAVTVTIGPDDSLHADFVLNRKWVDRVDPKPSLPANVCGKHLEQMRWVLVATNQGQVVLDPRTQRLSPNAWPHIQSSNLKVAWGASCPRCVHISNDLSAGKWRGLRRSASAGWRHYQASGIVDFDAPKGFVDSIVVDSCTKDLKWTGKDLRIEMRRIPFFGHYPNGIEMPVLARIPRYDYAIVDLVGDCRAEIVITQKGSAYHADAFLASTTNSTDDIEISVVAKGKDADRIARTILGTMRFPEPVQ